MLHQPIQRPQTNWPALNWATPAARPGVIDHATTDILCELMHRKGLQALPVRLADGTPAVRGSAGGVDYLAIPRDTGHGPILQFVAYLALPALPSAEQVEAANRTSWFVRIARQGDGVQVAMEVALDGGVSRVWLARQLVLWETYLGNARDTLGALLTH